MTVRVCSECKVDIDNSTVGLLNFILFILKLKIFLILGSDLCQKCKDKYSESNQNHYHNKGIIKINKIIY